MGAGATQGPVSMNGRPTDYVFFSSFSVTNGTVSNNSTVHLYWDQATGVAVNDSDIETGPQPHSFSYILIATNAWTIVPEFSSIAILIIMSTLTATIVAHCVLGRRGFYRRVLANT
jgi:hypothetical protein